MKIGDLWVKLGLKKDEFSRGIKEAGNDATAFGGKMKALSTVATGAWAAIAAAVVKFATDSVKMTQKWGDAWDQTMAGIKGAYSSFVRQISSGEGWSNLFSNMREAYRVSKEIAAALDEIFERKTSYSYQEAQTEKEIAQWQLVLRDSSKSDAERKKAAQEIIAAEERLAKVRRGIYEDEAKAHRNDFKRQTGIKSDEDIDYLVKEYNKNREVIKQARKYNEERAKLVNQLTTAQIGGLGMGGMMPSPDSSKYDQAVAAIQKLDAETSDAVKHVAELTKLYDKGNDELVKSMAEADVAVIRVDTDMMHAQTRATAMLGTLTSRGGESGEKDNFAFENALARAALNIEAEAERQMEQVDKDLEGLNKSIKIEPIEIVPPDFSGWDDYYSEYQKRLKRTQDLVDEFKEVVATGFSDAIQELFNQFAGLEDINPGRIVQALLTPLADMAIKEGEILIATGLGVEAVKEALKSLQGPAAIVAGAALIAVGAAAKSGLAALANTGGRATSTTTAASSASSAGGTQDFKTEMTVYVKGTIRGSDIVLSGQNTVNGWKR